MQVTIKVRCGMCRTDHEIVVKAEDLKRYKEGTHAQHAFPYLTATERELIISGTCDSCFNELFPDED